VSPWEVDIRIQHEISDFFLNLTQSKRARIKNKKLKYCLNHPGYCSQKSDYFLSGSTRVSFFGETVSQWEADIRSDIKFRLLLSPHSTQMSQDYESKYKTLLTNGSKRGQPISAIFRGVLNALAWSIGLQTLYANTTVRLEAKCEVFLENLVRVRKTRGSNLSFPSAVSASS